MIDTIIIPVLNRYDLLDRCIATIGEAGTVIIIDNGDCLNDEDARFWQIDGQLSDVGRVIILRMPTNMGVATSWNLGIKMTPESSGWLLLNSDAHFAPGAYERFVGHTARDRITLAGTPPWCCAWIGADVVEDVGLFCERFYPAYMEDVDYERRARICDHPIVMSDADVIHDNSSTIAADPNLAAANRRTHAANLAYYEYRWANKRPDGLPDEDAWDLRARLDQSW
jgi:GT2 family glycosyltransferase